MRRWVGLLSVVAGMSWGQAVLPQDTPPRDAQATVVVKDEQGNAVAGARVILAPTDHVHMPMPPVPEPVAGTTDAEGRCTFANLPRMTHYVLARTDTLGAWGRVDFGEPPQETLELALKPGLTYEGTVRDNVGKPLPGVAVVDGGLVFSTTDEQGRFTIPNTDPEQGRPVVFIKEGYGYIKENYWRGNGPRDLIMAPGSLAEGVATDPEGKPVAGARVFSHPFKTETDEQGRFRIGWFPADQSEAQILVQAQRGGASLSVSQNVPLNPGKNEATLVLTVYDEQRVQREAAAIEGRVVMAGADKPVPSEIWISYAANDFYSPKRVDTKRDGTFRIENLPGDATVSLVAMPKRKTLYSPSGVVSVKLEKGETKKDVVLLADEGCAISGTLLDAEGKPVPEAEVIFKPWGPFYRSERTGRTGAFFIPNLEPNLEYVLEFPVAGNTVRPERKVGVVGKGEIAQVEVRLDPPMAEAVLRGTVVDAQTRPVPGARVSFDDHRIGDSGTTDNAGRFEMPFRVSERREVELRVDVNEEVIRGNTHHYVNPVVEVIQGGRVTLEPGKPVEVPRVVIRLAPRRYLTGRVTDPGGRSIPANLRILSGDAEASAYNGPEGFMVKDTPEHPYAVEVWLAGYRARVLESGRDFPVDARELNVTLQPGPFPEGASVLELVTGHEDAEIDAMPGGDQIRQRAQLYRDLAGQTPPK